MHFLSFEGLDGSGKSTLMKALAQHLQDLGRGVVTTREPGGTPLAEDIRQLILRVGDETPVPRAELFLYEASRAQHVAQVIRPALARGAWVLCDRFSESSVAFQCYGRELPRAQVDELNRFAEDGTRSELVVLLDLPLEVARARQGRRAEFADRMEREADDFHQRVRRGFLEQAQEEPKRWLVLDASQPSDALFSATLAELQRRGWL
jgi:dTMP kinase